MNERYNPNDPAYLADHAMAIEMDKNPIILEKMRHAARLKKEALQVDKEAFATVADTQAGAQPKEITWPFTAGEVQKIEKYPKEYKEFLTVMVRIQQELHAELDPLHKTSQEWSQKNRDVDLAKVTNPTEVAPEVLLDRTMVFAFLPNLDAFIEEWRPENFERKLQRKSTTLEIDESEKFAKFWWQNISATVNDRTFRALFGAEQKISFYVEPLYPDNQNIKNAVRAVKDATKIARDFFEKNGVKFDEPVPLGTKINFDTVQRDEDGNITVPGTQLLVQVERALPDLSLLKTRLFGERIRSIATDLQENETLIWNTDTIGLVDPDGIRNSPTKVSLYEKSRTGHFAGYRI